MASSNNVTIQMVDDNNKQQQLQDQQNSQLSSNSSTLVPPPQYQPPGTGPTAQGFSFNVASQQLIPVAEQPYGAAWNRNPYSTCINEPAEAAVSRPLAIIALFCWCQIWFSIPAAVFAFKRNKPRSVYNKSIALSVTAIVIGICISFFVVFYAATFYIAGGLRRYH